MASHHSGGSSEASFRTERTPTFTIPDPNSVQELGRTYHGYREGKYYLPNDGDEQDRLDIQHKVWRLMMKGALYWAPVESPKKILDIACGTGIWAIQVARQHPEATVIGTELSLIQPPHTPPNCSFIREDAEDPWVFSERFDLVHLRAVCSCFADPRAVVQKVFDQLAPGGWCEYDDFAFERVGADGTAEAFLRASPSLRFLELAACGLRNVGRDPQVARRYRRWMEEVGFVDVAERPLLCPVNGWPLDPEDRLLGQFMHLDAQKGVPGMVKVLLASGMPPEEVPAFLESVRYSDADVNLRAYNIFYVVYGRKPVG